TRAVTSSGVTPSRAASSAAYADVAKPRLQSLTQPLPSVLPSTAMTSAAATLPPSMSRARPLPSSAPDVASRSISMRRTGVSSPARRGDAAMRSCSGAAARVLLGGLDLDLAGRDLFLHRLQLGRHRGRHDGVERPLRRVPEIGAGRRRIVAVRDV